MPFKKSLVLMVVLLALGLQSCGTVTMGVVVAGLGIAGAGLQTYCSINSCPSVLVQYAPMIIHEAVTDIPILESGVTTTTKIAEIVAGVQGLIAQGNVITGLSDGQTKILSPILDSLSLFLNMLAGITPAPPPGNLASAAHEVKLPALTVKDKAEIVKMYAKINALK